MLAIRHNWGADQIYFHDPSGHLRFIPTAWTSLNPEDPAIKFSDGRAPFRLQDLLELARLIEALRSQGQANQPSDDVAGGSGHV